MDFRKSSYVITTCVDHANGQYVLMQGYTGAIDIVNKEIIKYLSSDVLTAKSFPYSKKTFFRLVERGYITKKSKNEEIAYVKKVSGLLHQRNKLLSTKNFTFLVTYDCNFRCPYCFEREIIKDGNNSLRLTFSKKLVDKAFEAISKIEPNKKLQNRSIQLFGGEPLLKENKEIVKYIVNKGRNYGFTFVATSNGYDLDCYEDLLKDGYIQGVQVTVDGSKTVHDSRRIHSVNIHSFDKIIGNIKMALNRGIAIKIRINIDSNNIGEIVKLNNFFNEAGLYSYEKFSVYAAYISGEVNFNPTAYEQNKLKNITQQDFLNTLNSENVKIKHDEQLYLNIYNSINKNKNLMLFPCHCDAQNNSYIFDPLGNLYSCLEIVGNKNESIGTYKDDVIWTEGKNKWFSRNTGILDKCSKCKYVFLCGGGCFAKVLTSSNHIESYCDGYSTRFKDIVCKIYSRLKDENMINV